MPTLLQYKPQHIDSFIFCINQASHISAPMASTKPEGEKAKSTMFNVHSDGRVERFMGTQVVSASLDDPNTNALSKDAVYSQQPNLSARLYLPKNAEPGQKLPLLVYYHGGGFIIETAFSPTYHNHLNLLVPEANVIAVSVDYRRAPEDPLPAAYEDSWAALKWVMSHNHGNGPEEWLNNYADFSKVTLAGDSAGANIAHHMALRNSNEKLIDVNHLGIVLVHAYFWGVEPVGNETRETETRAAVEGAWRSAYPATTGCDDPLINPFVDPNWAGLGCSKILLAVAEQDWFFSRGRRYYELLKENGWKGEVEIFETQGEHHVFHLIKPSCDKALEMLRKISSFLNRE